MSNVWYTNKDFPCDVVATSNTALTGLYTIDGIPLTDGMFVLAASQSDLTASGPYIARPGSWDRIISLATGQQFYIASGTTYGKSIYEVQTLTPIIIGVTNIILGLVIGPTGGPPTGAAGGDLTGTYPNPILTNTGVVAATYPTAGSIPVLAINSKGRITSASSSTDGSALTALNASNLASGTVGTARLPTGISATNIGTGTVDNTEFGYLDGVTSSVQTQIDSKLSSSSNKLNPTPTGAGKVVYDTGTGYAETTVGTSGYVLTSNGSAAPTWNPAGGPTLPISEVNGGTAQDNTTIASGFVTKTGAGTYVGRSLASGNGITITNPAGTAGNPSIAVLYGSATNTAVQGNDARMNPAPSVAGTMVYDTGSSYTTITAGTTSQILRGGTLPSFGGVPTAALASTGIPGANVTGTVPFAALPIGQTVNTVAAGNDNRMNPVPSVGQGKMVYDNAGTYAVTVAGTTSQVLIGGNTPAFGSVPFAALSTGTGSTQVAVGDDPRFNPSPASIGNIPVDTGSGYTLLGPSTQGKVLTTNSGGNYPSWEYAPGSAVTLASFSQSTVLTANNYFGPYSITENSTTGTTCIPWVAPCAGNLTNFYAQLVNTNGFLDSFTVYRSVTATPTSFSSTGIVINVTSLSRSGSNSSILSVAKGDCILFRMGVFGHSGPGLIITAQFEPYTL